MGALEAVRQLIRQGYRARPEDLADMAMQAAPLLGVQALVIYVVDHQQRTLLPLTGDRSPAGKPEPIDGTLAGRAYSTVSPTLSRPDDGEQVLWVPLLDGSERMGVLQVFADRPLTDQEVADCATVAALVGELVVTGDLYSDTIERLRRREPMRLAAEMLRAQLPPLTFATSRTVIAGILEPCYDVGGDAFDYAVNGETAHLALFDAVGHGSAGGMRAVVLACIAIAAYRNARRAAMDLTATYHHLDNAVREHDRTGLITAVLAELDQHTGILRVISAGHPSGIVLRRGRVVTVLPTPTALPVTLGDRRPPVIVQEVLEPGDQILLYTDGIIEARDRDGDAFGIDRLISFAERALSESLPAAETARRLVHAILKHQDDCLQDDATVLLLQWQGPVNPEMPVS
ncbi:PP2C family protein-serine/threonine phosphatase [Actinoplanes sp. Pm04-4]|uniref:PP2C family protein-serine/threonine phosphatase n=1 Tax=Paractinoplanes pyxinae TaxID=2997416 RepID=A0ABT4BGR6_9ACTN|nr:PP2C family protein-serine/threonine phosphatase [Actinoplanes pyxinae]MCY1145699.1 PP2C family protein-serine/threonine phosphatase [Actinoplanes pyxinae]